MRNSTGKLQKVKFKNHSHKNCTLLITKRAVKGPDIKENCRLSYSWQSLEVIIRVTLLGSLFFWLSVLFYISPIFGKVRTELNQLGLKLYACQPKAITMT